MRRSLTQAFRRPTGTCRGSTPSSTSGPGGEDWIGHFKRTRLEPSSNDGRNGAACTARAAQGPHSNRSARKPQPPFTDVPATQQRARGNGGSKAFNGPDRYGRKDGSQCSYSYSSASNPNLQSSNSLLHGGALFGASPVDSSGHSFGTKLKCLVYAIPPCGIIHVDARCRLGVLANPGWTPACRNSCGQGQH